MWLSAGLVGGVVADALLGAIVVYTKLNPWLVSGHMALSLAMVVLAGVLFHRATHRYGPDARHELRCPWTVPLARWLWVALAATLLAGMATTGRGRTRAGARVRTSRGDCRSRCTPRPGCTRSAPSRSSGIVAGAYLVLERTGAAARVTTGAKRLLVVGAAQGVVGVVQYATHLPVLLVELHVLGAVAITIGVLQFQLAQVARDREVGLERVLVEPAPPSMATL